MFRSILRTLFGGAAEPALRKMRNRLLTVNVISLTLVIIVAFSLIYISSYNRTQNDIEKTLYSIPPGVLENLMLSRQIVVAAGSSGSQSGSGSVGAGSPGGSGAATGGNGSGGSGGSGAAVGGGSGGSGGSGAAVGGGSGGSGGSGSSGSSGGSGGSGSGGSGGSGASVAIGGNPIIGGPSVAVDYTRSFVANINSDDSITVFSMLGLEKSDYVTAVTTALENGTPTGDLNMAGRTWRYNMRVTADTAQGSSLNSFKASIVFLDVDEATRGLRDLALSLSIIGIVAIGIILLLSLAVANRAIRPVEESMIRQRRFIADASHELKTPIAVIAANAEAAKAEAFEGQTPALDYDGNAAGVTRWIDNIADEAIRMDSLVKNLLSLAKTEEMQTNAAPFDLTDAIREEADRIEVFLYEKNIAFVFAPPFEPDGQLTVYTDRVKLRSVLSILLENAVKYTPDGGSVTITAGHNGNGSHRAAADPKGDGSRHKNAAWVAVTNTGDYIPPEDIAHVFDRFFRADRSRSSETGGHGIGLSIAREITRALGGEITAMSVPCEGGGAVNTFTLYI